jgi:hypothetical protein
MIQIFFITCKCIIWWNKYELKCIFKCINRWLWIIMNRQSKQQKGSCPQVVTGGTRFRFWWQLLKNIWWPVISNSSTVATYSLPAHSQLHPFCTLFDLAMVCLGPQLVVLILNVSLRLDFRWNANSVGRNAIHFEACERLWRSKVDASFVGGLRRNSVRRGGWQGHDQCIGKGEGVVRRDFHFCNVLVLSIS